MKQLSKISVVIVLISVFATSLMAQPQGNRPQRQQNAQQVNRPFMMIPDLTDAQQDQIKSIHLATMKEVQPLKNQLMEKRAHLKTLSTTENADIKAINKQIDEISALQASIQKLHAASAQKVRVLLTDEQRVAFDAHSSKMMGNRSGFGGGHRGRGPGMGMGTGNPNGCPFNN